jgi:uncharacterized membrane protein
MTKGRMEAFSDGVIAILITIMVLELKVPQGKDLAALRPLVPVLLSYVISFVYLGIYWNNHHHLLHAVRHVDGRVLWANLHLLFWLSLLPFVTHWTGETGFAAVPVAAYGGVLLLAGVAYWLLVRALIARRKGLGARVRDRLRLQGQCLDLRLPRGHPAGLRRPPDRERPLRGRRGPLARTRPAHRAGARRAAGIADVVDRGRPGGGVRQGVPPVSTWARRQLSSGS